MKRLVLVVVTLLSTAVLAQSGKPAEKKKAEPKPLIVIFTPDQITGEADSPNGVIIETLQRPEFPPFFKVRENFDDKLRESVHEL